MLEVLWSLLGFVVAISVLVCFHELGHFWMARRLGVKVLRFSLGWGKPVWTRIDRQGVEWSLGPYPIGGYVKMLDEREGPVAEHERAQAFNRQSVRNRIAILFAGPAFNFLLAIALYWVMFLVGVPGMKPVLAEPPAQTAAARAGLHAGDEVLAIDGTRLTTWTELRTELIDRVLGAPSLRLAVRDSAGATRNVEVNLSGVRPDPLFLFDDLGLNSFQPKLPPVIDQVESGSAAARAGLETGDRVLAVEGKPIEDWTQLVQMVRERPGQVVSIEIDRAGSKQTLSAVLARSDDQGRAVGRLGAGVSMPEQLWQDLRAERQLGPIAAIPAAIGQTWTMTQLTLRMLWRMVLGDVSVKNVSGPIQIAQVAGYSAQIGLISFLSFMAVVSVSLGVLNLLPVPLLDGGHMLMFAIEGIKGKPLSERVQATAQYVGLGFIAMLMMLALFNDIMRLI